MSEIARQNGNAQSAKRPDSFVRWPLIVVLVVSALWAVVVGFFPLLLFMLIFVFWLPAVLLLGAGMAATLVAVAAARHKAWRRAVSAAVLPVAMVAIALNFTGFSQLCREVGDHVHFYLERSEYLAEVRATRNLGQPVLKVWNWGGMIWSSKGVVYDESDEIALPPEQQSAAWKNRVGRSGGELVCRDYGFEPMGSHFYLAYFPC
jgi:hypothetical protein